ncbi:hypothetical protein FGO68_gene1838 [Halteria grandinella]|uniref:Uncharacterized protein n=1 Tax=Halteria grandinella TaxID=5974 RepID=A0A8J8NXS8_HALGN|nr:hypothetical protein FGO68_gene1838 [Halteria grandinella]
MATSNSSSSIQTASAMKPGQSDESKNAIYVEDRSESQPDEIADLEGEENSELQMSKPLKKVLGASDGGNEDDKSSRDAGQSLGNEERKTMSPGKQFPHSNLLILEEEKREVQGVQGEVKVTGGISYPQPPSRSTVSMGSSKQGEESRSEESEEVPYVGKLQRSILDESLMKQVLSNSGILQKIGLIDESNETRQSPEQQVRRSLQQNYIHRAISLNQVKCRICYKRKLRASSNIKVAMIHRVMELKQWEQVEMKLSNLQDKLSQLKPCKIGTVTWVVNVSSILQQHRIS